MVVVGMDVRKNDKVFFMVLESVDWSNFDFFVVFFFESVCILYGVDNVVVLVFVWSNDIDIRWFYISFEEVSNNFFYVGSFGVV